MFASLSTQVALRGVTKSYDRHLVLDRVTCSFVPGETTGLIGENGSGKTMLRFKTHLLSDPRPPGLSL